jgi:hypothetical protein
MINLNTLAFSSDKLDLQCYSLQTGKLNKKGLITRNKYAGLQMLVGLVY